MAFATNDMSTPALEERFRAQAARTAAWMLKRRARDYRAWPARLEILYPGLACSAPSQMIAIGETLLRRERTTPRRHFGFGGEIPAINAKATILLGRYRRRFNPQTSGAARAAADERAAS